MNNALLYLGGLLALALAALFAVPYVIDWNGYRGVFEEEASRILGREVRVGGNVALRILPSPYVSFEKLRIADTAGETGRPLIRADSFTMWLSIPPLLKGVMEARDIELRKPEIELAVDADGRGNWSTLSIKQGSMPIVPKGVALQAVRLIDASIGFSGPGGVELARLTAINGELSAEALDGPFKFKGNLSWNGSERDVRLSTAQQDAAGSLRFKAIVTAMDTGNTYTFDGMAADLTGQPRLEGDLSGKLSAKPWLLDTAAAARHASAPSADPAARDASMPGQFDFRSKVAANTKQLALDEIAVTLEQGGPPQLISGQATVSWVDRVKLDVSLNSKWLDLDVLSGQAANGGAAQVPLETARAFFERFVDQLPESADTNATFALDQVGLGKQVISGLRLTASRTDGPLKLTDVRASLPGGALVSLDGELSSTASARAFKGTIALSGQSLVRFASWGFGDTGFGKGRNDGPFSVEGQLLLSDQAIELQEATAELNGIPLLGDVRYGLQLPRRLAISLEGHRIDIAQVWSDSPGFDGLRDLLFAAGPATTASEATASTAASHGSGLTDISLNIKAAEVIDGPRTLRDVEAEVALEGGKLSVPALRFTAAGGLLVDLEGSAINVPDKPRGSFRGVIDAPKSEAVTALAELFGAADSQKADIERLSTLTPWRLGTTVSFGERLDHAVDVTLDGLVRGGRMVMSAKLDGARVDWRKAATDVTVTLDTPDINAFIETIAGPKAGSKASTQAQQPGRIFTKAAGIPANGLVSVAQLNSETMSLDFTGRVAVEQANALSATGDVRVASDDIRHVLSLAGITLGRGAAHIPVRGTIATETKDGVLTLTAQALTVGTAKVGGVVTRTAAIAGKPLQIMAELTADEVVLPSLLSVVQSEAVAGTQLKPPAAPPAPVPVSRKRQAAAPLPPPAPESGPAWSDQTFDLSVLNGLNGTIKVNIRSLSLEAGLAMRDARLTVNLAPGRIDVTQLEGAVLGGKASSTWQLDRQAAGASLTGGLKIGVSSRGRSETGMDDTIESDVAALDVTFSGKALSPLAMMGALQGKGHLTLGDVTLSGVSPQAISEVSEAALQAEGPSSGEPLVTALREALKVQQLKLGKVSVPVAVGDGVLTLAKVQVETSEGRATFDTVVDLQSFKIDSEWKIEGKAAAKPALTVAQPGAAAAAVASTPVGDRKMLPAVSVIYTGKLKDLGSVEPTIVADALERELTVRRMERDVDELERLRTLDQQRAKDAHDRQKAIEAEKAKQSAVQPPPAAASDAATATSQPPIDPATAPASTATGEVTPEDPNTAAANVAASPTPPSELIQNGTAAQKPRKKRLPQNSWKPFQVTPYQ